MVSYTASIDGRRARIERLARLAKCYRGWTAAQLNEALGREPSRVAPVTGNPKLDLVARLADALEWEIGDVARGIWCDGADDDAGRDPAAFADLDARAQCEHRAGDFHAMESTARAMRASARTPRERAVAANRLAGACDGLGHYAAAVEAVRDGLAEQGAGGDIRLMLAVNLANGCYTLWHLDEAHAIASSIASALGTGGGTRLERVACAFAHAIRGHAARRMLGRAAAARDAERLAVESAAELADARVRFAALHAEHGDPQYEGLAFTAEGGAIEAEVALGRTSAGDALERILEELERFVDIASTASPQLVEGAGWWSVFGANIALRSGAGRAADIDRTLAICTNKASEVAEHLGHWPIRERTFTLEWFRRSLLERIDPGARSEWMLDGDDVRILVGTMARFPHFRRTGWEILDRAVVAA